MALPLFVLPATVKGVTPGTEIDHEPRVNVAPFGDGYIQRSGDGINGHQRQSSLIFDDLTDAEANAINDFFTEMAGYKAFRYAMPRDIERKWTVPKWKFAYKTETMRTVTATFRQVFDNG